MVLSGNKCDEQSKNVRLVHCPITHKPNSCQVVMAMETPLPSLFLLATWAGFEQLTTHPPSNTQKPLTSSPIWLVLCQVDMQQLKYQQIMILFHSYVVKTKVRQRPGIRSFMCLKACMYLYLLLSLNGQAVQILVIFCTEELHLFDYFLFLQNTHQKVLYDPDPELRSNHFHSVLKTCLFQ